jgi:WD40 repeat protein
MSIQLRYNRVAKPIGGHARSINAVSLSHDARYIASGGDDKYVRIFSVAPLEEIRRYRSHFAITALTWNKRYPYTVISGDRSGDVHTIRLGVKQVCGSTELLLREALHNVV